MKTHTKTLLAALGCAAMTAGSASAATTLFSDDFSSNAQGSWIVRGPGSVDFSGGAAAISVAAGNGQPEAIYHTFSSVQLANTGDYIEFKADVSISNTDARNQDVRTGLGFAFDTFTDNASTDVPVDGYFSTLPSNGNDTDSNVRFMEPSPSGAVNFFNPSLTTSAGVGSGSMGVDNTDTNSATSTPTTWVWRVERDASGDLVFSGSFNGVDFTSTATATGSNVIDNYEFNTVGLAYAYKTGETATYDNVSVVSNIPEPSSLALLGLGGLLIARRRRG